MIQDSIDQLNNWFNKQTNLMVALSGGVDSCLVAFLARKFLGKQHSLAVISDSSSLKRKDLAEAILFCKKHDINYHVMVSDPIDDQNYVANPDNRCYYCKSHLYKSMLELQASKYPNFTMANGNNADDKGDYRPGLEAAKENEALSPLMECGIGKDQIRRIAKHFNLQVWDKPASPCLSSRFPYGEAISIEKLKMVELAENTLNDYGFDDCRVRYYNGLAKVEVPSEQTAKLSDLKPKISEVFQGLGFQSIEIDEEGLISGKLNRALGFKVIKE